jgi:hypothetical protein
MAQEAIRDSRESARLVSTIGTLAPEHGAGTGRVTYEFELLGQHVAALQVRHYQHVGLTGARRVDPLGARAAATDTAFAGRRGKWCLGLVYGSANAKQEAFGPAPLNGSAAEIPGARYVSLPSANHLMLEEEPAWSLFLEELGLFLNW